MLYPFTPSSFVFKIILVLLTILPLHGFEEYGPQPSKKFFKLISYLSPSTQALETGEESILSTFLEKKTFIVAVFISGSAGYFTSSVLKEINPPIHSTSSTIDKLVFYSTTYGAGILTGIAIFSVFTNHFKRDL